MARHRCYTAVHPLCSRSEGTVDSRNLAEYLSSSQVTERNGLALQRIDAHAGLAIRNEEYVIGFWVMENQLTRLITHPVAVRLNALGRLKADLNKETFSNDPANKAGGGRVMIGYCESLTRRHVRPPHRRRALSTSHLAAVALRQSCDPHMIESGQCRRDEESEKEQLIVCRWEAGQKAILPYVRCTQTLTVTRSHLVAPATTRSTCEKRRLKRLAS